MSTFDPSADLAEVADGTQSVTLRRRGADSQLAGEPIAHALRRAILTAEAPIHNRYNNLKVAPSDGRVTAADATWHLPCAELAEAPRLGDVLLDAQGQRWTVLEVVRATLGTRWQCTTRNLVIAHGLDDTITILRAFYQKQTGGAAEAAWLPWKTGIRARIQPSESDASTDNDARRTKSRFYIFLEEDLEVNHTHRVLGPDGTVYRLCGSLGRARIGEAQCLDAEVVR